MTSWNFCRRIGVTSWNSDPHGWNLLRVAFRPRTRGWAVVIGFCSLVIPDRRDRRAGIQVLGGCWEAFGVLPTVLVIFQPELRRMLAELGNFPFSTRRGRAGNIESLSKPWNGCPMSDRDVDCREQSVQLQEAVESGIWSIAGPLRDVTDHFSPTMRFMMEVIIKGIASPMPLAFSTHYPAGPQQNSRDPPSCRHRLDRRNDAVVVVFLRKRCHFLRS